MRPHRHSPLGSSVPGILQARTLEWVAISFSNAWKGKVKVKLLSPVWLFTIPWSAAYQAPPSTGFSRQEYWSGLPLPSLINSLISTMTEVDVVLQYPSLPPYHLLFSHSVVSDSLWPHGLQHARLPCPSLSPGVCSSSSPLSWLLLLLLSHFSCVRLCATP